MAGLVGLFSRSSSSSSSMMALRRNGVKLGKINSRGFVCRAAATGIGNLMDQYRTLRIQPGASEMEVKKAFRQLALQGYHPDVCKGSNCGVQFHLINEAYDIVMSSLRDYSEEGMEQEKWRFQRWSEEEGDEPLRGMCDTDWELWEEWMGWEGAGTRDYSSHINPYI